MIFGKTDKYYRDEREREVNHLKMIAMTPEFFFAFMPKKLDDGRSVWLQTVKKTLTVNCSACESYIRKGYDPYGPDLCTANYSLDGCPQ